MTETNLNEKKKSCVREIKIKSLSFSGWWCGGDGGMPEFECALMKGNEFLLK